MPPFYGLGTGAGDPGVGHGPRRPGPSIRRRSGRPPPAAARRGGAPRPGRRTAIGWSAARTSHRSASSADTVTPGDRGRARRRSCGRPGPAARPGRRRAGARASGAAPAPAPASSAGSAWTAARSTSWSGIRVWTSTRPPPSRVPTSRAARASRASVSSPAANRGASRCWSMSRKATASARLTRWSAASVPTTSRAPAGVRRLRRRR